MSEHTPHEEYFAAIRERQTAGWYETESQRAALDEWDRMMAAHDAEVREHARHEFCDARLGCVVAEEPEGRSLTPDEINALPIGSVVMTETNPERFGAYEQRVWQKFGGEPDWQFGMPRHEWQSTDGGFERVGNTERHRGQFGFNRRVTLLWVPVEQGDER